MTIPSNNITTASVAVRGMTCQHCADSVTKGLAQLEGINVSSIKVDLDSRQATFSYTGTSITKDTISKAIEDLGYDAGTPQLDAPIPASSSDLEHARIEIIGMTCSHCVNSVTRSLSELEDITKESIMVILEKNEAEFNYHPGRLTEDIIRDSIDSAGYDVRAVDMHVSLTTLENSPSNSSNSSTLKLNVVGMTCDHCSSTIRKAIQGLEGVKQESISIDVPSGKITLLVSGEEDIVNSIKERIDDLGYDVVDWKKEALSGPQSNICSAHISIQGMTCSHCTFTVHEALSSYPSVIRDSIVVSLDNEEATLLYNSAEATLEDLQELIEDIGYDVENITSSPSITDSTLDNNSISDIKLRKAVFRVLGMTCDSCSLIVSEVLKQLPGALPESVRVGLHTEMGMVVFEGDKITPQLLAERLDDAGYEANNIQMIHNLLPPKVIDETEADDYQDDNSSFTSLQKIVSHISDRSLTGISISSVPNILIQDVSMQISGMTCASCVGTLEKNIKTWSGVLPESVGVNLLTSNAVFKMEKDSLNSKEIAKKIKQLGYKASDINITSKDAKLAVSSTKFQVQMLVTGMYCTNCEAKVKKALQELPGIISNSISVSFDTGKVKFQLERNATSQRQIQRLIQKLGFSAEGIDITKKKDADDEVDDSKRVDENLVNTRLIVTGMTCSSCVSNIEKTLLRHDGISRAQVNLLAKSAFISHNPNIIGSRELVNMIEQIGYKADLAPNQDKSNQRDEMKARMKKEERVLRNRFLWSLLFAIPVLLISMIFMMALPPSNPVRQHLSKNVAPNLTIANLVLFILSTPVQFILGNSFYIKAYRSLRYAHTANMETLVALGTSVAYIASVGTVAAAMAKPDSMDEPMNYFETSVFLITFIHLGKWLEALAKGKTAETITKLMDLQPEKAILVTVSYEGRKGNENIPGNQEVLQESEIDTKDIQVGDILKVRAGDRIPCDGKIWRGTSTLDESMITGESIPVTKNVSSDVITATINMSSEIYIRAVRVGSNTTLSRIIQLVQDAQSSPKAPIEVMADKISSIFVPVVILLAVITFIIWEVLGIYEMYPESWITMGETKEIFSLMFAVSVLVIACPCGLGLASPTAVMVGTGVAARHGVLVKGGGYALEMANRISAIAFDKTGTLTTGKPTVRDNWILLDQEGDAPSDQTSLSWKIFGLVAGASNHPLSKAIKQKAKKYLSSNGKLLEPSTGDEEPNSDINAQEKNAEDSFRGVDLVQSRETPGRGITATIIVRKNNEILSSVTGASSNVYNVFLGNEEWMKENLAKHTSRSSSISRRQELQQWQSEGMSIVMFAISPVQASENPPSYENLPDGCQNECSCVICNCASHGSCEASRTIVLAQIAIADQPRPEAKSVISSLRASGIEVWMITGDNPITGKAVARQIGIDEGCVLAGVKPEQKADKIKNLQRRTIETDRKKTRLGKSKPSRGVIAMIGDGINDSPALAQADVGISVGSATDIAIEAASIVLIRNNLSDLLTMHDLSRTVVRRIRINFLWAFVYNIIAIPIAAGVIFPASGQGLPPYLAGLAMVVSSVSVVCSSLMLRLYRAPSTETYNQ
ncbi:E1-E2 ATPase-domain-containing protein [Umbelopsis sp. PMI_123]|nr:E1-E2 ATPase-domain-containing protein [Umbelopsis sp. PMI_123]